MEEAEKRGEAVSPSSGKVYGLARVCRVWKIARSSLYFKRANRSSEGDSVPRKRGPKGQVSDKELLERIKEVLESSPWVGEGYRKVWARLRALGLRVSQRRVLRLMREGGLLAKERPKPRHKTEHKGRIYRMSLTRCGVWT